MIFEDLKGLIETNYQEAINQIEKYKYVPITYTSPVHTYNNIAEILNEYDAKRHKVFDPAKRKDKIITESVDEKGNATSVSKQPVARLAIPMQRKIVSLAASFLCGNPIQLDYTCKTDNTAEQTLAELIQKVWDDNKLDYKSKKLAKILFAETEVAELWYWPEAEQMYWAETEIPKAKYKLRMKILAGSLGDLLWPVFDPTGDLIAFGRGYRTGMNNETAAGATFNSHFDIYTVDKIYYGTNVNGGMEWQVDAVDNLMQKIPVIYYRQAAPDWYEVQEMIERLETLISNHADTNDYFGDPTVIVKGQVTGFAKKGETGKMLEIEPTADVKYLTWDQAPESIKMEIENLWKFIHTSTSTPDISFENVKGLGNFSGIALKMLFLDAHMKASDKEEIFGEGVQRRINYIKSALAVIDNSLQKGTTVTIKPKFEYYLPKDNKETIDILNSATQGGLMSIESAVKQNPLVENGENELELLNLQNSPDKQLNNLMNDTGGIVKPINTAIK